MRIFNKIKIMLSKKKHCLENFFLGEDEWNDFVGYHTGVWDQCDFQQDLLLQVENKLDLAQVIYSHIGDYAITWMEEPVPALDGLTPVECLQAGREERLKSMLMRM